MDGPLFEWAQEREKPAQPPCGECRWLTPTLANDVRHCAKWLTWRREDEVATGCATFAPILSRTCAGCVHLNPSNKEPDIGACSLKGVRTTTSATCEWWFATDQLRAALYGKEKT